MNTRNILIGVVACILLGGVAYVAMEDSRQADEMHDPMIGSDMIRKEATINESVGATTEESESMMLSKKGTIESYSPEKIALAQTGKVVLFFHAEWCPICRQFDAEAKTNPAIVPDGVHVLKVDYDTAIALRQKYGVTLQHTFVQVDATGAAIDKWSDVSAYSEVFARLK